MPHETLMTFCVPNHARRAGREVGLVHPVKRCSTAARTPTAATACTAAASSSAPAAPTSSSAAAPTSSATAAGREGGRGERENSNQQSRAERRNEAAALLAIELKKSAHR
jgi:hypothetical protein